MTLSRASQAVQFVTNCEALVFAKEISIRDQLTTQLMLGVVTGELQPRVRLPSTRALARRFRLHPNTVSAAYRQLEQQRWVEAIRGSGVYVRGEGKDTREARMKTLDHLALDFVRSARRLGVSAAEVRQQTSMAEFGEKAIFLTMPSKESQVLDVLPPGHELITLQSLRSQAHSRSTCSIGKKR